MLNTRILFFIISIFSVVERTFCQFLYPNLTSLNPNFPSNLQVNDTIVVSYLWPDAIPAFLSCWCGVGQFGQSVEVSRYQVSGPYGNKSLLNNQAADIGCYYNLSSPDSLDGPYISEDIIAGPRQGLRQNWTISGSSTIVVTDSRTAPTEDVNSVFGGFVPSSVASTPSSTPISYVKSSPSSLERLNQGSLSPSQASSSNGFPSSISVSNSIVTFSSASAAVPTASTRPNVTLPDDGPARRYVVGNVSCLENGGDYDSACWGLLNLNMWLPVWLQQTPNCTSSTQNCRHGDEPWTTTFLRIAEGGPGPDCVDLIAGGDGCAFSPDYALGENDAPLLRARYKYVRRAIYAIAEFFTSWKAAMDNAMDEAQASITGIINLIDKIKKTNFLTNILLGVLGACLAFIPFVGPELSLTALSATQIASNVAIGAIRGAPQVATQLWPVGTAESRLIQDSDLSQEFSGQGGVRTQLDQNFANTMAVVQGRNQTDVGAFLAFAGQGSFSTVDAQMPYVNSTPQFDPLLLSAFTTFLTSAALDQNGWRALFVPGANPVDLHNKKGQAGCPEWIKSDCGKSPDLGCTGYDENGQCMKSYWWYSKNFNSSFTLLKNGNVGDKDAAGNLQQIFANGWATGASLFENAAVCEFENLFGQSQAPFFTIFKGQAGLQYTGDFPIPGNQINVNGTTNFTPFSGGAFPALTENKAWVSRFGHPGGNFFSITPNGLDLSCVSQLSVSVANSWKGTWMDNNPK